MDNKSCVSEAQPFMAMIMVECVQIGLATLSKAAIASGLSQCVYIVYYDTFGTIILLPWFVCRCLSGKSLPITFPLLCRLFGLSLIGKCLFPIFFLTGLGYSSVTLGAAIGNLYPIITSLLAICLRMDKLDLRRSADQVKALGIVVAVLGALTVTFYKGPVLLTTRHSSNSSHTLLSEQLNWTLGGLFFTVAFLIRSIWSILQADTAKSYPDEVSLVFFYTLFGTIQTAIASFVMVKDPTAWNLPHKIEIIAIVYSAFSVSVFTNTVVTWCLRKKGPVYVSMFDPLHVVLAVVMGFVFLGDNIYLGSVMGSATVVIGFYAVMWGKGKTTNSMAKNTDDVESASDQETPLLKS